MNILADNWAAAGSIGTGFGAIAAFLAILATLYVYVSQSRGNKAAEIRQNLQFIHSLETQVTRSIDTGFLATIDRQIREFRVRLGPEAKPGYFLEQLFDKGEATAGRSLFKASALESNLSSTMYIRMNDIWDSMNMKAFEFRGALCIFSYASQVLTEEARRLCEPETTLFILDAMAKETFSETHDLDELVNELLSHQNEKASCLFNLEESRITQGCLFINTLADKILCLKNRKLLKLANKNMDQPPGFVELADNPCQTIDKLLCQLQPTLPDVNCLRKLVGCWDPQPSNTPLQSLVRPKAAEPCPTETSPT